MSFCNYENEIISEEKLFPSLKGQIFHEENEILMTKSL